MCLLWAKMPARAKRIVLNLGGIRPTLRYYVPNLLSSLRGLCLAHYLSRVGSTITPYIYPLLLSEKFQKGLFFPVFWQKVCAQSVSQCALNVVQFPICTAREWPKHALCLFVPLLLLLPPEGTFDPRFRRMQIWPLLPFAGHKMQNLEPHFGRDWSAKRDTKSLLACFLCVLVRVVQVRTHDATNFLPIVAAWMQFKEVQKVAFWCPKLGQTHTRLPKLTHFWNRATEKFQKGCKNTLFLQIVCAHFVPTFGPHLTLVAYYCRLNVVQRVVNTNWAHKLTHFTNCAHFCAAFCQLLRKSIGNRRVTTLFQFDVQNDTFGVSPGTNSRHPEAFCKNVTICVTICVQMCAKILLPTPYRGAHFLPTLCPYVSRYYLVCFGAISN